MAAIYQWFPSNQPLNYDYFVALSDQVDAIRYYGYDFDADEFRVFGQVLDTSLSMTSDEKNVFTPILDSGNYKLRNLIWRGHAFSDRPYITTPSGANQASDLITLREDTELVTVGNGAYGHAALFYDYTRDANPITLSLDNNLNPADDNWGRIWDVHYQNEALFEYGKAVIIIGDTADQAIVTVAWNDFIFALEDFIYRDTMINHCFNRFTGILSGLTGVVNSNITSAGVSPVQHVSVDESLQLSFLGETPTTDAPQAAVTTLHEHVLTAEFASPHTYVRSYEMDGTALDEYVIPNKQATTRTIFAVSPMSQRIWLYGAEDFGFRAFSVDGSGIISQDGYIPGESAMNAGGTSGSRLYFLESELEITPNGYTGIKEKLYECWELEEATGNRVGAMGNIDMIDSPSAPGTCGNTTGKVSNAVLLGGTACLETNGATPAELQSCGNFSVCCDFKVDALTGPGGGNQHIWIRADTNAVTLGKDNQWDCGAYVDTSGNVFFWVNYYAFEPSLAVLTVQATGVTVVPGTWYHLYCEFNEENNTFGIRVNNGTIANAAFPATESLNVYNGGDRRLTLGRRSTGVSDKEYLAGAIDQFYWFYDVLTTDEQNWMYNSGNSRAFSEL